LLEAIPEYQILSWSDPEDDDNDGISGVPQYSPDKVNGGLGLGRFGFRASSPTLAQQSGAASFFDMGVTNPLFMVDGEEPETSAENFEKLVIYQALAGVPIARDQDDPTVIRGKELFQTVGCDGCHKMTVTTSDAQNPELDGQVIHPFTDLLLHDMGDGLADERAEFSASGSEWKTTPLWGLGFYKTVSHVTPRYLHDGRALTIEEAILWHGGEAEAAQEAFKDLPKADRKALIKFLKSL
ncbi:MAG: thiol oxidoreductase, partial [Bdellovibrionales bacterium]|nr:thiol oxidoreductase [Bdellovibrionales bacterium]